MAVGDITKTLNGIDLDNPARGWSLLAASTVRPGVTSRRSTIVTPGRHGVTSPRRRLLADERTVGLSWLLQATSQASLEAVWRDLMGLLQAPSLTYGHVAGGVTTVAEADLVSVTDVAGEDFLVNTYMQFTAVLALPGVFLRDVSWQTVDVPAGASTHTVLAGSAPVTDAVVRWVSADLTSPPSLTDVTTGTGVSLDVVTPVGSRTFLDVAALQAWRISAFEQWTRPGTQAWWLDHLVDYPAPGPLQLWPAVRESDGSLVREVRLQSSHACTIRYRRAWL